MKSVVSSLSMLSCALMLFLGVAMAKGASIELEQAGNGSVQQPSLEAIWGKGNLGRGNSHYAETHSIPYRAVIRDLAPGPHTLVIEWDTKSVGNHAIDFITSFDRLKPHDIFGTHDQPELVDPLAGVTAAFGEATTFPIPVPSGPQSPIPGQPALSFLQLPETERVLTLWNGTITAATHVVEEGLDRASASSQLSIEFVATNETVVLAWGGHIAAAYDWGLGQAATEIRGAPYHMRLVALDDQVGAQDRSLEANDTPVMPPCTIVGPGRICAGSRQDYQVAYPSTAPEAVYAWHLADHQTGASLVGATNKPSIQLQSARAGTVVLEARVGLGDRESTCQIQIEVGQTTSVTPLADRLACWGSEVLFEAEAVGEPPLTYLWTRDGEIVPGATNAMLRMDQVTSDAAGQYCIRVSGPCGTASQCAKLEVTEPPVASCPEQLVVTCLEEVPPPDPGTVRVMGGWGEVVTVHLGDQQITQGCDIEITRTYLTTDACGLVSECQQTILVQDRQAPELVCPDHLTLEFPASTDPAQTGSATATDACGEVIISFVDRITEECGDSRNLRRTWMAVDACGNQSSCVQMIQVVDTTSPEVICPEDIRVECEAFGGTVVEFEVTATDASTGEPTLVVEPPSGSRFPPGTTEVVATATDACGNSRQCRFQVVVEDTTPPTLGPCPADRVLAEDPPGSGGAVLFYDPPMANDLCDEEVEVVCVPPSGSVLPVGFTTVVCTATDDAGNQSSCQFTVQVVPEVIVANSTADRGPGTLRQALLDANAAPGINIIAFDIPGEGPFTIELETPLPVIAEPTTIDGTTQPGFFFRPVIDVDGSGSGAPVGLRITGGDTLVRGVVLSGFDVGLRIDGKGGNVVQGNYIGLDPEGILPPGNRSEGIVVTTGGNIIGGPNEGEGNVIGGNGASGILLEGAQVRGNVIQGNCIGVQADGVTPAGNAGDGVRLAAGASNNLIGGTQEGEGNKIGFNGGAGVGLALSAGNGNPILGNRIVGNEGLGIDLGLDGPTPNDPGDADVGPNGFQNAPVITAVTRVGEGTQILGRLQGVPGQSLGLEFFRNESVDPSGFGEGALPVGSLAVQVDEAGGVEFEVVLSEAVPLGHFVTATATDGAGNTSEFSGVSEALQPPVILVQPVGTNVNLGAAVTFCVGATGTAPLRYQWRHNGVNIPGATNTCYRVLVDEITRGGDYAVVVANRLGAVISEPASLLIILPELQAADFFADRTLLEGQTGIAAGNNFLATREPGEPFHFGKPGQKSVWYTWQAPQDGIAEFRTTGSTFDTLLAIYTGESVEALRVVAADEDRGGFFTSGARFNAVAGRFYHVAIDGLGTAAGRYVFEWTFQNTNRRLPEILQQPESLTVPPGDTATFRVVADEACFDDFHDCRHDHQDHHDGDGHPLSTKLTYQWLLNGQPIEGATNPILDVEDVRPEDLGSYTVLVTLQEQTVESFPALLQINRTGNIFQAAQAQDKFVDALFSTPVRLGLPLPVPSPAEEGGSGGSIVRGFTGSHALATTGSTTEANEPPICSVVGGASQLLLFVAGETGELNLTTEGSSFDTVISVSVLDETAQDGLRQLACNDDATPGDTYSELTVPVADGSTNIVRIDGVEGATGLLNLNYSLVITSTLFPLGTTAQGAYQLQLMGRPEMRFQIQYTDNFTDWFPLLEGEDEDGTFEFVDEASAGQPLRYYRALMLP